MFDPLPILFNAKDTLRQTVLTRLSEQALIAILLGIAAIFTLLIHVLVKDGILALGFFAVAFVGGAFFVLAKTFFRPIAAAPTDYDWSLVRETADNAEVAVAITDRTGRLVCANALHESWFGQALVPPALDIPSEDLAALTGAGKAAWRDGRGSAVNLRSGLLAFDVEIIRCGRAESHLIWRFRAVAQSDILSQARRLIDGSTGDRLGEAGLMGVVIGQNGKIVAASKTFILRAAGRVEAPVEGREFVTFLEVDQQNIVRFANEGRAGPPLRVVQIPIAPSDPQSATFILLLDEEVAGGEGIVTANVTTGMQSMLAKLPLGLALADRDGRFLFLNDAFCRAVGQEKGGRPVYPGDLVVREDKAAVADTIRRHANGQPMTSDIAVRLIASPEEPVALTIAGARGLGEAAVLLSIKDSSEESRLKRQVAQQTKMQAVGQLAGGVAHDFNNILTAIIGHCDLMLMRHTPGDSDYDDIQQIKNNSNRAAGLTRQLLAFSRQQTLRPQILQLPDIVSEISNLLNRLMGETITLEVKHGRNLGAVRADPGQLEQVVVNLAVNARDAMPRGGKLTIQTFAFSEADVRTLGSDILPPGEYTALSVTDTGLGIPPELLPKIFEPFFTTKDVGKGTGLGLSTVYGIVKQSGGYIFADSVPGEGTRFVIYLPVHANMGEVLTKEVKPKEKPVELWGSGTVLLVEDEDMVRAVAERALVRHGYQVITAENGEDGLARLAESEVIDLIISDVVMPIMDGPSMAEHARKSHPDIPILFMSGYAEEQLRKSISLENVNFLPKPFSVQQLAEAARGALQRD